MDLHWMSATELANAIATKQVSSAEALEHFVTRIERLDGDINAVVQWDLDRARSDAVAADRAVANGDPLGPLHGVPMTCLLYTSPSPRDATLSRMPSSA